MLSCYIVCKMNNRKRFEPDKRHRKSDIEDGEFEMVNLVNTDEILPESVSEDLPLPPYPLEQPEINVTVEINSQKENKSGESTSQENSLLMQIKSIKLKKIDKSK